MSASELFLWLMGGILIGCFIEWIGLRFRDKFKDWRLNKKKGNRRE